MNIGDHWQYIKDFFRKDARHRIGPSFYAFASVNEDGSPHITPIGSLILSENNTGFYFDNFPSNMQKNFRSDNRVCVFAMNSHMYFWFKAIFKGSFDSVPGIRLIGSVGEKREATSKENRLFKKCFLRRFWYLRFTKGYKYLWGNMKHVREIHFDSFEPIQFGLMTQGLWKK